MSQGRPQEFQAPFLAVSRPLLGPVRQFLGGCFSWGAVVLALLALVLRVLAWASRSLKGKAPGHLTYALAPPPVPPKLPCSGRAWHAEA